MDPYTITIQGFGTPAEAATVYELIMSVITDNGAPCRARLNIVRDSDTAQRMRYEHRMAELAR